jgi:tRNA-splicing ligase RtcB (3'-phosphate/5'-hydroxy nucleic acid ligase)
MKINKVLAPWKGDKRFTEMAKRAVQLKKSGLSDEAVAEGIAKEFGSPPELAHLRPGPQPHTVYGIVGQDIDPSALQQLILALRLPIAVRGALMPDAHHGYALPIGGVFAAHRAVSPSMVGVDIGCRMHLSIFDEPVEAFLARRSELFSDLQAVTYFGTGAVRDRLADHEVLDDGRWKITSQLRGLRDKAASQLGTSGSGNHFAELVVGELLLPEAYGSEPGDTGAGGQGDIDSSTAMAYNERPLAPMSASAASSPVPLSLPRRFCGLLTHSGSRSIGYALANAYMRLAGQETARVAEVPKYYEWLDLDRESGQEYWQAMELACAYARANHEVIHASFARRSKLKVQTVVQNHHNFAELDGDLVIHRKGATPAGAGVLGVIPGSMADPSYIVVGQGVEAALNSASHGAGRQTSRTQARATIGLSDVRKLLKQRDVLVQGLSADESPQAYKNIERVIEIQVEAGLIAPLARMRPVAVIMAGEKGDD